MFNKKLLFILLITASSTTFAMQEMPTVEELQYGPADIWVFERDLSSLHSSERFHAAVIRFSQDVLDAYPDKKKILAVGTSNIVCAFFKLEDNKENIVQKFKEKAWFASENLHRPPYALYPYLNRNPADIRNHLCCALQ